jgi:hypothetical protein
LKSTVALKHEIGIEQIGIEQNQAGRPLIGPTRGDFFTPMIMYAVVLRHGY